MLKPSDQQPRCLAELSHGPVGRTSEELDHGTADTDGIVELDATVEEELKATAEADDVIVDTDVVEFGCPEECLGPWWKNFFHHAESHGGWFTNHLTSFQICSGKVSLLVPL
jgi:hypothetical protein